MFPWKSGFNLPALKIFISVQSDKATVAWHKAFMGYAKKGQLSATTTPLLLPLPLQVHINRNGFLFLDTAVLLLQLPFTLSSKSWVFLLLLSDKACFIAPPFKAKINCLLFLYLCFDPRQVKKGKKHSR